MAEQQADNPLVGRGNKEGTLLFRQWFQELSEVAEREGQAAYVFVMGSMAEILKVFDLPVVFPEINSLQTAVRRVAHEYLNEAEDYGYSPDICGYVKADVAVQLRGGQHPMGRIPKPALAVLTNACNTYIKWAEIWERMYHIPVFTLDVPGTRAAGTQTWPGDPDFENDRRYVAGQVKELIGLLRRVGIEEEVTFTGGVPRNTAMVYALNAVLGLKVNVSDESHFMGALGAALFALDHILASRTPAHEERSASLSE